MTLIFAYIFLFVCVVFLLYVPAVILSFFWSLLFKPAPGGAFPVATDEGFVPKERHIDKKPTRTNVQKYTAPKRTVIAAAIR